MSAEDYGRRLPATPRLQSVPTADLAAYRAEQTAKLNGLAWVDQSAGEVRMPINAAMRLIVSRADSFADQHAKAPENHSWAFPGAAHMDTAAPAAAAPAAAPATGDHAPATPGTSTTPAAASPSTPHPAPQH
jgi:hypothetical protein